MTIFSVITFRSIVLVFLGATSGLVVGALPGLSVTMATALLVSLTYTWNVNDALALIMGVYVSGVFSGAISAILIKIPGAPSSIATTLDGFPMSQRGEPYRAIWLSTVFSFIGGLVGFAALAIITYPLSNIALMFSPMDYFLLGVLGLTTAASFTAKQPAKGVISAALGILLAMVGSDPIVGNQRFTFGSSALMNGISAVPALIGVFGFSEVLSQLSKNHLNTPTPKLIRSKIPISVVWKNWWLALYCSVLGTIVGALPGAGAPVASLIAYDHAKKMTRNPKIPFGEGADEGIIASESANNACVGGAFIPLLTLAVPGDAVTAVILSVFYIHGIRPGPFLLKQSPEIFNIILSSGIIACFVMLFLGLTIAPMLARIITIPQNRLIPVITLLCIVGAYAGEGKVSDIVIMLAMGILGFILNSNGFPTAPLVLGLVLGSMIDQNFRRAVSLSLSSDSIITSLFSRPITITLSVILILTVLLQFRRKEKV